MRRWSTSILFLTAMAIAGVARAVPAPEPLAVTWQSAALGHQIHGTFLQTTKSSAATQPIKVPLVIYLTKTSVPTAADVQTDYRVAALRSEGNAVLTLDYEGDPQATATTLPADLLKLREDLNKKRLLADTIVDENRTFILPEGYALARDVEFYADDKRAWKMDVAYPAKAGQAVPLLFEITCDNASRMGNGSLLFCRDTLVEGALLHGFAAAMIDHPVSPPYKGLDDPTPTVWHIAKAAVRTMRANAGEWHTNGKIGAMGFSRGAPFAAMLALSNGRLDLEGAGPHRDASSDVQAALVHGNRFDYLDLLPNDPMLARFAKAWGERETSREKWAAHSATAYAGDRIAPMFLNTSDTESDEYRDGLAKLGAFLSKRGVEHVYRVDADGRGHRVTTDPETLGAIYSFFRTQLN